VIQSSAQTDLNIEHGISSLSELPGLLARLQEHVP